MMLWYGHGLSSWGWVAMTFGMLALWALVIVAVVWLARAIGNSGRGRSGGSRPSAPQLLAERFARGEIDESEYRHRLAALQVMSEVPRKR